MDLSVHLDSQRCPRQLDTVTDKDTLNDIVFMVIMFP